MKFLKIFQKANCFLTIFYQTVFEPFLPNSFLPHGKLLSNQVLLFCLFLADETANGIVGSPYCIAFDWVGRNLYIGNIEASEISMVRVDGKLKYRKMVLDSSGGETGVSEPIAMALHPASGRLFWLDRGGRNGVSPKIGKVNMDGSQAQVIISKDIQSPEFMTIDLQKEVLYFSTSHGSAKIESCNLDGTNRQVSLTYPHT